MRQPKKSCYAHARTLPAVFCYAHVASGIYHPNPAQPSSSPISTHSPITNYPSPSHTHYNSTTYAPYKLHTSNTPTQPTPSASPSAHSQKPKSKTTTKKTHRSSSNSPATHYCHTSSTEAYCCGLKKLPSFDLASPSGSVQLAAVSQSRTRRRRGSALG